MIPPEIIETVHSAAPPGHLVAEAQAEGLAQNDELVYRIAVSIFKITDPDYEFVIVESRRSESGTLAPRELLRGTAPEWGLAVLAARVVWTRLVTDATNRGDLSSDSTRRKRR